MFQSIFGNVSRHAWRVWQRDAEVYRTTWLINFLPPLLEPIFYVLAFGLGMGQLIGTVMYQGEEIRYLHFMVPGVISVAIMFWPFIDNTYGSFVRMHYQGTFNAIMATPLLVEDVIIGEWLWGTTKAVVASSLMLVMMGLFGLITWPSGLLVIPIAIIGGCLFAALGLITTAISPNIDAFNLPIFIIMFPMFLFSGTFFPVDILPPWAFGAAMVLPLTHISSLIRGVCLGTVPDFWIWSIVYLLSFTTIATSLAIVLMRRRLVN